MRGSIGDIVVIIVLIFAFVFALLIGSKIFTEIDSELGVVDVENVTDDVMQGGTNAFTLSDSVSIFLLVGMGLSLLISSFLLKTHPAFMIFFVLILVFILVLGAIISNAYDEMGNQDTLSPEANKYTITASVMSNLPVIILGLGFLVIIVLFGKNYSGGGGL